MNIIVDTCLNNFYAKNEIYFQHLYNSKQGEMFYSNQNTPILIWIWLLYLDQVGFQQPESSTMYYVTRYQNVISNLKKKYFFSRKKMLKKEF